MPPHKLTTLSSTLMRKYQFLPKLEIKLSKEIFKENDDCM